MLLLNLLCVVLCLNTVLTTLGYQVTEENYEAELSDNDKNFPTTFNPARNFPREKLDEEKNKSYWNLKATLAVQERLLRKINQNVAKNVILFIGDGMSLPTLAATRVYIGGEEAQLSFEKFPYTGLSKTYCVDYQTADSGCSATAYLGGVKGNKGTIGVSAAVNKKNCTAMRDPENQVDSIARLFQLKGKRTGLVTTTRVTHASPAGLYAHTAWRRWESDRDVLDYRKNPEECEDIAHQLVFGDTGKNLNVIIGGGRRKFIPTHQKDQLGKRGERCDKLDLISEWKKEKKKLGVKYEYIWNKSQLLNLKNDTEFLLSLFDSTHMKFNLERNIETDPSLEEMTETAIKVLQRGTEGYFLFVEGGKIDKAHHYSKAHEAIDETAEFAKAVQKAVELTNEEDTLIVVTSDHSHTMSYSGYAKRGSDVFGYAGVASDKGLYTILSYANGPGYTPAGNNKKRYVPSPKELAEVNFKFPSTTPLKSETHGADDVAIFARGPWAHLFTGVMEQNVIPHLISFASCTSKDYKCHSSMKNINNNS